MKNNNDAAGKKLDLEFLRFTQKKKLVEETVGLAIFSAEWILAEDLNYTDEYRTQKCMKKLRELLGGPDGPGLLQKKMNEEMDGIMDRLQADFPKLKQEELLVFSHSVAGLTNDLSARLANLSCSIAVSVIRNRLRGQIRTSSSPNAAEYLALLPDKGCRFGEEMLYLHNLKYRKKWKK